jgi:hypothetical protein
MKILQFYIPLWAAIGYNTYCYVTVYRAMKTLISGLSSLSDSDAMGNIKNIKRLMYYPMILVICWFFGTLNRLQAILSPDDPVIWLTVLHILLGSLQGLFNAVVYGISGPVKRLILKTCCPCLPISYQLAKEDRQIELRQQGLSS